MNMNFYAVIPAPILTSKQLTSNEKILYGIISSLTNKLGYCYAGNSALTEYFERKGEKVHVKTISRWVNNLVKLGYLTNELIRADTNEVEERRLRLVDKIVVERVVEKPVEKQVEEVKQNSNDITIDSIISYLNQTTKKNFNKSTKVYRDLIGKHLEAGKTIEDFMRVIEVKSLDDWFIKNPQYFVPTTIFRESKFDGYLNSWTIEVRQSIYAHDTTVIKKDMKLSEEEF